MNRREFLRKTTLGGAAYAATQALDFPKVALADSNKSGPYVLPKLPFDEMALEPYISANTVRFHYGKHHQGYVDKMNELIKGTPMVGHSLEQIMKDSFHETDKPPLFNASAQIWNHNFFWKSLKKNGGGAPKGKTKEKIEGSFGSYKKFSEEFSTKAVSLFGSGWTWLVQEKGSLKIVQTSNADNPLMHGQTPLITIDVWEHAYYLDYQNKRKDFVQAVIDHLLNWEFAEENLTSS